MLTVDTTYGNIRVDNKTEVTVMNKDLIELFARHLRYAYSKDTMTSYKSDLVEFFQFMQKELEMTQHIDIVKSVDYVHGLEYITYLSESKGLSPFSVNRKLSAVNTFLDYCVKTKIIENNNVRDVRRMPTKSIEQKNDYLTTDEYRLLLQTIATKSPRQRNFEFTKARDLFLFSLILTCGLRITETVTLTFEQIDIESKRINLVRKGGKRQSIPINNHLVDLFNDYLKERNKVNLDDIVRNNVFISVNGREVTRVDCYRALKKYCGRADIKSVSNHDLRHTCATRMVGQGMNIKDVSEMLGHSNLSTTSRYVHGDTTNIENYMVL